MKNSTSKSNSIKFLVGLIVGITLYILTNSIMFLFPLMVLIIIYNEFLSKYFKNNRI